MAEHLFGGPTLEAVSFPAHGLGDVHLREGKPPPGVLVLPAHVRVENGVRVLGELPGKAL